MKLRCRLSWQEDKGNDRKGWKHGKPGEEEKRKPLRHNPPPRYDRQWKEMHSRDKQDGSQFRRRSGRNMLHALGWQRTRAQMATKTGAIGGHLGPYRLKKALIDPGSTRTLVSEEFVNKHSMPMQVGPHIHIELANGQIEVPVSELCEPQRIEIAGISTTLDLPVVQSRGVYDLLLGRNWLRVLKGSGDYGARTTYCISGNGRTVVLRNTRDGCILVQIGTDEIALKVEQNESKLPRDGDWATTSSGSTHTSDYTWTERASNRSSGEDSVSSGEVPTQLSIPKRVKSRGQNQCCAETFLHCMSYGHRIRMRKLQTKGINGRRQGN